MTDKPDGKLNTEYVVLRRISVAFAVSYPMLVAILVTVKALSLYERMSWSGVFYGPALTIGSIWMLLAAVTWIESRWRRR